MQPLVILGVKFLPENIRVKDATYKFLAICFLVFSLEIFYPPIMKYFTLAKNLLFPITAFTHIFAHATITHFIVNMLMLFFFGPELESIIGSRRFALLFIVAGVFAGVGQILMFGSGVIGASGAIMGIFGCLTVLNPRMKVYLFLVIPLELWMITLLYVWYDIFYLEIGPTNVAHIAHLIGLGIGAGYGYKLRKSL